MTSVVQLLDRLAGNGCGDGMMVKDVLCVVAWESAIGLLT